MTALPMTTREANQYGAPALAFLGDAVYERLVREKLLLYANMPANKLHKLAVKYVCCEFQSAAVEIILPSLTDEEIAVYKRGRNSDGITPPKHSSAAEYRRATGFEALFGYLSLIGGEERIREIFEKIWKTVEICID